MRNTISIIDRGKQDPDERPEVRIGLNDTLSSDRSWWEAERCYSIRDVVRAVRKLMKEKFDLPEK